MLYYEDRHVCVAGGVCMREDVCGCECRRWVCVYANVCVECVSYTYIPEGIFISVSMEGETDCDLYCTLYNVRTYTYV